MGDIFIIHDKIRTKMYEKIIFDCFGLFSLICILKNKIKVNNSIITFISEHLNI